MTGPGCRDGSWHGLHSAGGVRAGRPCSPASAPALLPAYAGFYAPFWQVCATAIPPCFVAMRGSWSYSQHRTLVHTGMAVCPRATRPHPHLFWPQRFIIRTSYVLFITLCAILMVSCWLFRAVTGPCLLCGSLSRLQQLDATSIPAPALPTLRPSHAHSRSPSSSPSLASWAQSRTGHVSSAWPGLEPAVCIPRTGPAHAPDCTLSHRLHRRHPALPCVHASPAAPCLLCCSMCGPALHDVDARVQAHRLQADGHQRDQHFHGAWAQPGAWVFH